MTREEAVKYFKRHLDLYCVDGISREAEEMAIQALSQEPTFDDECQKDMDEAWEQIQKKRKRIPVTLNLTPCDEKRDCSTCKYEEYSSNYQPCRDCGTLLESYTNWEQKERASVTHKSGKWIAVNEREPEEENNYLVSFDDGFIATVYYADNDWELWADAGEPIAWMPLPKPYTAESEE